MLASIGLCLAGLLVLIAGAELVTRSGGALAARLGIPPIIIGLTIVAVGTSAPELAVGIEAAVQGRGPLAVGNIAGTNTVNTLLILGLSAAIQPLMLRMQTLRMDLPVMIFAVTLLWGMAADGRLSRVEGAMLILTGVIYTSAVVRMARKESRAVHRQFATAYRSITERVRGMGAAVWQTVILLAGITIIVVAADWFVDGAVGLARLWGVSESFIGLTVVAIGTSSPELVTTLLSTFKRQRDIAIGNLLGSSIYNVVFILGATCMAPANGITVSPELIRIDIPVMVAVAALCVPVFLSGRRVSRLEGAAFVALYVAYLSYLIVWRT